MEVSFLVPVHGPNADLAPTLRAIHRFLAQRTRAFEIIVIPNPYSPDEGRLIESWNLPDVRVCPDAIEPGKGIALKAGVQAARGRLLYFTDADLPYDLGFFDRAKDALAQGASLVVGNRRLPESRYLLSVASLGYATKRLWWSLCFSRVTNGILGLGKFDTQAGIKAMTREFALQAFERVTNKKFHFDIELFLVARARGLSVVSCPVVFTMRDPSSTLRLSSQLMESVVWVSRFFARKLRGAYR